MKNIIPLVLIIVDLIACSPQLLPPSKEDLANCKSKDCSMETLHSGYKLYVKSCGSCHSLFHPSTFSNKEWGDKFPEMFGKANVDTSQQQLIINYIYTVNQFKE